MNFHTEVIFMESSETIGTDTKVYCTKFFTCVFSKCVCYSEQAENFTQEQNFSSSLVQPMPVLW